MHLRSREADADIFVHRLHHIVEELLKIVRFDFINRDRLSLGSDDGMTEARDFQNHESISLSRCSFADCSEKRSASEWSRILSRSVSEHRNHPQPEKVDAQQRLHA